MPPNSHACGRVRLPFMHVSMFHYDKYSGIYSSFNNSTSMARRILPAKSHRQPKTYIHLTWYGIQLVRLKSLTLEAGSQKSIKITTINTRRSQCHQPYPQHTHNGLGLNGPPDPGLRMSPILGRCLSQLMSEGEHSLEALYNPSKRQRVTSKANSINSSYSSNINSSYSNTCSSYSNNININSSYSRALPPLCCVWCLTQGFHATRIKYEVNASQCHQIAVDC